MSSTTTLRNDPARTGTNPDFPISTNPWRKISIELGTTKVKGTTFNRAVRAGALVVENWLFHTGPHAGQKRTLVLVATTTNEVFCFAEGDLLAHGSSATALWQTSLGVTPMTRATSNIAPPLGVCGTPVVDTANRRMFVVAMWDDGSGTGNYSIFTLALDTGQVTGSQKLVDPGAPGRATFNADEQDQRTAINLVNGWLWLGFAAYQAFDKGRYYGWAVAINAADLTQQLYLPMISLHSSNTWGIFAGGIWGPGGLAAAPDGTVYALTGNAIQLAASDGPGDNPADDLTSFGKNYWHDIPGTGPGSIGDYFNALVHLGVTFSGSTPQLQVLDWFQGSDITRSENAGDLDFGGSSPVVLPPIDGRQLVAFVPKDGNIFVLDAENLGNYTPGLTRVAFGDPGNDTKVAIAFMQTPDGRNILIVGANSSGSRGGFAAFQLDAAANPPNLTKLWQASAQLRDSFGSPAVAANPVPDPSAPPNLAGLAWVIDGSDAGDNYLNNCAMRAYNVITGKVAYDSTVNNDVIEEIPHFAPITSGGNSVFCATSKGFMAFTQFPVPTRSLTFIMDRTTFGQDEVDAKEPMPTSVASYTPAYWIAVRGILPGDLGLTPGNLNSPPHVPSVTPSFDPALSQAEINAIKNMLNPGQFTGPVVPEDASVPDEPQDFLFPFTISFTGDQGFKQLASANPPIGSTLVTLQGSVTAAGAQLANSAQIELTTGEDPFFIDVNPHDPTQPTWLSFDLRLFKVPANSVKFGVPMPGNPAGAPGFITQVIANLNANKGVVGADSFDGLTQDESGSALEFNPTDNHGHKVFNFALARVRILGKTAGATPSPVRVFFRLFQAQSTNSAFNTATTYRFATDGTPHGRKIPLLGIQNDQHGHPEYVTIPCFATARNNLTGPADMRNQADPPNAQIITIVPGVEVDHYFGCWLDINQPQQKFLPLSAPAGNVDGPWTSQWANHIVHSIQDAIIAAPHQCLIAEIRYDDAPVIPNATSATSDKLAQRNIAWIDGPNPGSQESRRMTHPVEVRPTPAGAQHADEVMILWDGVPEASYGQLYVPALSAADICSLADDLHPAQHTTVIDEHTVGFSTRGVTFLPLPGGTGAAAGLLTVTLPPGSRRGDQHTVTVRQLTEAHAPAPPIIIEARPAAARRSRQRRAAAQPAATAAPAVWRQAVGAFQFSINIETKHAILLSEERLLATLRSMALTMPADKRWFPVLNRYIEYVAGRVQGFVGDPGTILPSPTGSVPGLPEPSPRPPRPDDDDDVEDFEGKIDGLIYDHFGDFQGVVFETETGARHEFFSHEQAIHDLAEAARHARSHIVVTIGRHHRDILRLVVLRRPTRLGNEHDHGR
jgi:hypothetical protein